MADLDNLRPEVREALDNLSYFPSPVETVLDASLHYQRLVPLCSP